MKDAAARIEVAIYDALTEARETRAACAMHGLSTASTAAAVIQAAREAACKVLFDPEIPFSSAEVRRALADAIARWAEVASAVSPEPGAHVPAWPLEPEEHRTLQ
jgi:hypothetical protein